MSLTEPDLAQILAHCRDLLDAATQLNGLATGRYDSAFQATRHWTGEHATTFAARLDSEADDLAARGRELKADADAWAQIWAQTVDTINARRRADAVDQARSRRGLGEQLVDVAHGDDSDAQVRPLISVPVPTAVNRYAATGWLETF